MYLSAGFDGLAVVEEACGLSRFEGCTDPAIVSKKPDGTWPRGRCPGKGKSGGGLIKKAVKKAVAAPGTGKQIAKPKAVAKAPSAGPAPAKEPKQLTRKAANALQQRMLEGKPWTQEQKDALQDYSEEEYLHMNAKLRGTTARAFGQTLTDGDPEGTEQRIKDAVAAMRPLPEPVKVFRDAYSADGLGLPSSYTRQELLNNLRKIVGQKRQERGFFSASIKPLPKEVLAGSGVNGDVRLEVTLPAGTQAAYIQSVSTNKAEDEMLVAPGLTLEFYELIEDPEKPILKARVVPA